ARLWARGSAMDMSKTRFSSNARSKRTNHGGDGTGITSLTRKRGLNSGLREPDTMACVTQGELMATNLKLDDGLINEAVKVGGFRTKQEAVNTALAEFVHRRQRLRILELAGKVEFDPGSAATNSERRLRFSYGRARICLMATS